MIGAPPVPMAKHEIHDAIWALVNTVDRNGRSMDEKWGINRLQTLVPLEWAEKFHRQSAAFSGALESKDLEKIRKQSEAMIRAYEKLDALAIEFGHQPGPPEQWEFDTPDGLVILVKDISRVGQVERHGRKCQVWSLDEIESVIRAHPEIAKAKQVFPGAELVSMRPVKTALGDADLGIPFL